MVAVDVTASMAHWPYEICFAAIGDVDVFERNMSVGQPATKVHRIRDALAHVQS